MNTAIKLKHIFNNKNISQSTKIIAVPYPEFFGHTGGQVQSSAAGKFLKEPFVSRLAKTAFADISS